MDYGGKTMNLLWKNNNKNIMDSIFFYFILTYLWVKGKKIWAKFHESHQVTDRFFSGCFFHEIACPDLMWRIYFFPSIVSFLFSLRLDVTMETRSELKLTRVLHSRELWENNCLFVISFPDSPRMSRYTPCDGMKFGLIYVSDIAILDVLYVYRILSN